MLQPQGAGGRGRGARGLCGLDGPCLKGHQPGGVEQEGVQVLGVDGPMERRLRATPLDFWQQVLNLLDGHKDLTKGNRMRGNG